MEHVKHIVFYDGHCILCSKAIQFLLVNDKHKRLYFSALQSETAANYLKPLSKPWPDSLILYSNKKIYVKSSAALIAISKLSFWYRPIVLLLIIPSFIRNWIYDWVAKNRYGWFGKTDSCFLPGNWKDRMV